MSILILVLSRLVCVTICIRIHGLIVYAVYVSKFPFVLLFTFPIKRNTFNHRMFNSAEFPSDDESLIF